MTHLKALWKQIEHGAFVVGDTVARVILTVLYVLFVIPVGLLIRLDTDPLARKWNRGSSTYWQQRVREDETLRDGRGQG